MAAIVVLGALTAMLDMTMVSVALARLTDDLSTSVATVQWVSTGYLLAIAMVIPLTAWAVERFGTRRMWLTALTVFLAGSALCGTAWSVGSLIAFRLVQGIGGGMIVPLAMMILAQAAGPARRGRVMSMVAVPGQLAPIAGPLLGGLIVDAASWRWIFFVNLPIGLVALLLAWRGIPRAAQAPSAGSLDVLGLALLSPGLAVTIYGLYRAGVQRSVAAPPVLVALAIGLALLGAFVVHALRARATPVLDLRLFTSRAFAAASALNFLSRMSIFGAMILLPLYYQQVRGESALSAGLLLAPQSVGTMLGLLFVGKLTDRIGARPVVLVGLTVAVGGTVAYTQVRPDSDPVLLAVALLVWGIGIAAATVPVMAAAYQGLAPSLIPRATSAITTIQTVGASFGAAVLVVILQRRLTGAADGGAAARAAAYGHTFWWALAFTALAFVPALLLPAAPRRR
ncbi:DHA2 family efflux MFS transporter permease subunit [Micromonospora sp. DR5-3]|uniref:DHA2 family efflux MFS transporter permease subunit n=1 Tax=unclassified Micromonospora TaxID=2617518 RepID=UPI002103AB5E|nr:MULTISPECIES: DHA2 family efflux MFS transporter permease subunit [unclassified Micromonospora]MCW3819447.1 DHA2 family efflux MFS transporter permease subunit [Micromonospora sp. DR5-3]